MSDDRILTVLATVAEQMGFLTALGPAAPAGPGPEALVVELAYSGQHAGRVAIAASPGLAEALARNLLALDPSAAVAAEDVRDALAELANVVAGNLLPVLHGDGEYRLDAPAAGTWPAAPAATAFLDCAEGALSLAVAAP